MKLRNSFLLLLVTCVAVSMSAAGKTVTVKNAHEFIKAIGPDRTIVINSKKPLNITDELEKMIETGEIKKGPTYYGMEIEDMVADCLTYCSQFDGNGLQVRGCNNMTIKGKGKNGATLLASPRYVNVMEFINCDNLNLENITMGHTDGGYCDKGVIEIDGSNDVVINNCDFFGCGTEGFVFEECNRVTVNNSCVHDCTYYTMHLKGCNQVRFNDCTFRNNMEFSQINISVCESVTFTGCLFDNLDGELFNLDNYHSFYCCTFRNCKIDPITPDHKFFPNGNAVLGYCSTKFGDATANAGAEKPSIQLGLWTDGAKTFMVTQADPYRYLFTSVGDDKETFAVNCMSVANNDYICEPEYPHESSYGRLCVDVAKDGKREYVRIKDDGGELIKSFFYLGKK